jgi:hypothetical protein
MDLYKDKYLKYKNKYLNLRKQYGGIIKKTSNEDIINAGFTITDNDKLTSMKKKNELDVSRFLNNNIYFEKSGNLSDSFTTVELNKLKTFFNHLWENTSNSFIDSRTKKFASQYFLLDSNHKYQSTFHITPEPENNLTKCDGFTWRFKNERQNIQKQKMEPFDDYKIIKFIEILKKDGKYIYFNPDPKIKKNVEENNINSILTEIIDKFRIDGSKYTKCGQFVTNPEFFSNLRDPEIFKNVMKTDDSDVFYIEKTNNFIIKSKKLLYFESKIMIIEEYKIENDEITFLKLKPYINQINVNKQYDDVLKKLFNIISIKINLYLKKNIIKVIPFHFYHIHIVKVKDEHKILLVLHAANEDGIRKEFNFRGEHYNKYTEDQYNENDMRNHNHILLIDLDNIKNIDLYSIQDKNMRAITKKNLMFYFTSPTFAYLKYSIFGNLIGHLSYFNDDDNPMNITLEKKLPLKWYQKASLYEYLIGKMLVLLNFEKLSTGKYGSLFIDNQFSQTLNFLSWGTDNNREELNEHSKESIKIFHQKDDDILFVYDEIEKLENDYLKCKNCVLDNTKCGHMIMSYFLYDPIEIDKKNIIKNLYGGTV